MDQNSDKESVKPKKPRFGLAGLELGQRERANLVSYMAVGIILVEFAVTIFAICHSILTAQKLPEGGIRFIFPWTAYLVSLVVAPAVVMLIVHIVGLGLSRLMRGEGTQADEEMEDMPEGMRRFVMLMRGIPAAIILIGIIIIGIMLYYLDAVINILLRVGEHAEEIAPWLMGGLIAAWFLSYLAKLWMVYKTKRMREEYAFRREVLERTGIVIVDKKISLGPDGRALPGPEALPPPTITILPPGESDK